MSVSLTTYWQQFVKQLISAGRYNTQSEVIGAGLRALEAREMAVEMREFNQVFAAGRVDAPDGQSILRAVARQESFREGR